MSAIPLRRIEGKYEILEKLREGGMGAIYKVRHRLLDEVRVIKLMRPQFLEDEELKARFLREARLAIKLRHPNIAQLYDFTVDEDGTAFIVMEFIDGATLQDVLALHGPPPLDYTLEIAQQSLKALGYLHVRGFIHRDVSPDNLMLTEDAEGQPLVKLIDLGLAKTLDAGGENRLTQAGTFFGKLRYAPPEQFGPGGTAAVGTQGDQYGFGVVLYELLTGRFPIQGDDPSSLIAGHLFHPPLDFAESDPAKRVPEGLRAVVRRALAKRAEDRFQSVQALSQALAEFRTAPPLAGDVLKRLLSRPFIPAETSERGIPGSTQSRLDSTFDLSPTPPPKSLLAVPPPPQATTVLPPASSGVVEGDATLDLRQVRALKKLLAQGDLDGAQKLLSEAAALYGEETFKGFQTRLTDLRRTRRAEAFTATVSAISNHLDHGELAEAGSLLDQAVVRFGAAEPLRKQWERLEALRREAKNAAGVASFEAHLAEARRLAAEERFEAALEKLGQADELFPEDTAVAALKREYKADLRRRRRTKRRASELALAVTAIEIHMVRGQWDAAAKLLDQTAEAHGEESPLPELRAQIEARHGRPRATPLYTAFTSYEEAAQVITDHLARHEPQKALPALQDATRRFGERAELLALHRRILLMFLGQEE